MYHRISSPEKAAGEYLPGLSATPSAFAEQLEWIRKRFDVLSLEDASDIIEERVCPPSRPLLITFDDGYLDNYLYARPALIGAGLPAVLFLVTDLIGTNEVPWWEEVTDLVNRTEASTAQLEHVGWVRLDSESARARTLDQIVATVKSQPWSVAANLLEALPHELRVSPQRRGYRMMMNWQEALEMEASGIACQPHTRTHPILSRIGDQEVRDEILGSASAVRDRLNRPVLAFAYPNGNRDAYDDRAIRAVEASGATMAFTTEHGPVRVAQALSAPFEIPRLGIALHHDLGDLSLRVAGTRRAAARIESAWRRTAGSLEYRRFPRPL